MIHSQLLAFRGFLELERTLQFVGTSTCKPRNTAITVVDSIQIES
jgi:hypothetical protein